MKNILNLKILFAVLATFSQDVLATSDVFRFVGYGPISAGMGGAATAIDTGAGGMMTNPATLSLMDDGSQVHVGLDIILTDLSVKNSSTGEVIESASHSKNRGPYGAPQLGFTHRRQSLTFGFGVFANGGVGTEYGTSSFLSQATGGLDTELENSSRLLTLNIPFAASFDVNDKFSVGGSIDAVWQGLNLEMLMGADQVGSLLGSGRVSGDLVPVLGGLPDFRGSHFSLTKNQYVASGVDAWGYTGRVGMIYKPNQSTKMGLAYTTESSLSDMKGQGVLTVIDGVIGQLSMPGQIIIRDFQSPALLNFGLSHQWGEQWLLTADLSRIFLKHAMKNIDVGFVADSGQNINILLPQNYRDQTALSLGAAFNSGKWTLRGGARFATQALRSDTVLAVIPAIPTVFSTVGFSYQLAEYSRLDFAWVHSFEETMKNSSQPNTSAPIEIIHAQDSLNMALTWNF